MTTTSTIIRATSITLKPAPGSHAARMLREIEHVDAWGYSTLREIESRPRHSKEEPGMTAMIRLSDGQRFEASMDQHGWAAFGETDGEETLAALVARIEDYHNEQ